MARKKKINNPVQSSAEHVPENTSKKTNDENTFAARFSGLMESTGKSIADISRECDISKVSLSKYANGSGAANGASLVKLARCFNVSTDYLLGNDANKKEVSATQKLAQLKAENNRLKKVILSYDTLQQQISDFNSEMKAQVTSTN